MGGSTNNVTGSRYHGGYADVTDLIGLGSGSASTLMARSFSGASNTRTEAGSSSSFEPVRHASERGSGRSARKRWNALRDTLHHHGGHASEQLRAKLSSIFGRSRTGSFTLPPLYKQAAPLRLPKDFEKLGLRAEEAAAFQALAVEYKWDIFVRTGTSARTSNVGESDRRPKPAGIIQKTSKDSCHPGWVLYKVGERKKSEKDIAEINHPDPRRASTSLMVLAGEGFHLEPLNADVFAVLDGAGNVVYGDIDIHGVYAVRPDGSAEKISADVFVRLFNEKLLATKLHGPGLLKNGTEMNEKEYGVMPYSPIQHGAHDDWTERNNPDYAGGVNMGPLPGVIHFSPDEAPYHIGTVPQYQECLNAMGRGGEYIPEAWANGRNRLAEEHFRPLRVP